MSSKTKTTTTKEEAMPALVPKLRFPEFRGGERWEKKNIGQVCKSFSGGTPNTARKEFYSGSIPFIRSAEIDRTETELFLSEEGLKNSAAKLVAKGDVLVALYGANSGDVALARIDGAINQAILCLKSDHSNAFVHQFLSLRKNWIITTYLQGGQGNLSGEIVKSISLGFPKPTEQQKIAECLSSVDELMAAQARKVDALKTHKKGLMQQLFPREGETQPRLRFPEFHNAGEWKVDAFNTLIEVIDGDRGANYPKADEFSQAGYCLFLSAKNVTKTGFQFVELQFVSNEKDDALRKGKLKREDVVLTTRGTVGQFAYFSDEIPFQHIRINSGMVILRTKSKELIPEYLYTFTGSDVLSSYIKNTAFGNAQQQLTVGEIIKFKIYYPSPPEQQRIASCLSSLDAMITAETQKLEALKTHKKGLMQQLFPTPEEVEA